MNFSQALILIKLGRRVKSKALEWHLEYDKDNECVRCIHERRLIIPDWKKIVLRDDWELMDETNT